MHAHTQSQSTCVCMLRSTCTCMHTAASCPYTDIHARMHLCACIRVQTDRQTCAHVHARTHTHTHTYTQHMHAYTHITHARTRTHTGSPGRVCLDIMWLVDLACPPTSPCLCSSHWRCNTSFPSHIDIHPLGCSIHSQLTNVSCEWIEQLVGQAHLIYP